MLVLLPSKFLLGYNGATVKDEPGLVLLPSKFLLGYNSGNVFVTVKSSSATIEIFARLQ